MARTKLILAAGLAAAMAGCVSAPENAPGWFAEQNAANNGAYPNLRDVPRESIANTNARYWGQVQREVLAAGAEMRSNPRAEPATGAENPAGFLEDAREDLETTRQAHSPE